ncbi:hypothetical protein [uncultured Clostridium sp.]|nr:hypothetical protein [uncultured Clostridium sp.]
MGKRLRKLIEEREKLYLKVLLLVEEGAGSEEISHINREIEALNAQIELE